MAGPRVKRNDTVYVTTGRDKGKTGKVLAVHPEKQQVLVEGINMVTRAVRPNPQKNIKGGLVRSELALHISNVAVIDPETNAPSRIGYQFLEDGSKVRVSRVGAIIDKA